MTNLTRPMFPHAVDSTLIGSFRSCPQKFLRTYIEHWKPRSESVHLIAGGAFASGIESARRAFFEQGQDAETSIAVGMQSLIEHYGDFECPPDSAKSLDRVLGAFSFYFDAYPLGADGALPYEFSNGRRGIEFSFANPLPINHPVTGNPMLYTGRADMIAHFAGGIYCFDEKTTSSLGASWSRQWEMRSQFTGYQWAAGEYGVPVQGTIVRGVSILKTKFGTQQVITYRSPAEVDRWLEQVVRDVQRMIKCWEEGYWDYNLDHSCGEYGGCSLLSVCKHSSPELWLDTYFEKKVWDPLERKELTMEEFETKWNNMAGIPVVEVV